MRVMVFEHVCGGGMCGEPLPQALVAQGGAMLTALVADFARARHEVLTTCDARVRLHLATKHVSMVHPDGAVRDVVERLAQEVDAVAVIAPECGGALVEWLTRVEVATVRNLGCTAGAAALCGDKLALARHLEGCGIPTPPILASGQLVCDHRYVVKPRFGAGCENTRVLGAKSVRSPGDDMIVQPYIDGIHVSVSLIVGSHGVRPLLAGEQHIALRGDELCYRGGSIPLDGDLSRRVITLATRAAQSVVGLSGFVGIDLVLAHQGEEHDCVIEINPRLTMSYVGLRELCTANLAVAMLDPGAPIEWRAGGVCFDSDGKVQYMMVHA